MGLDPRNAKYKADILTAPYEICIERARLVTQSYRETEGEHPAKRAARAFAHICRHVTLDIRDEERLIGNRSSKLVGTVLPVERGDMNVILELELDALTSRERQPYRIAPEDRRELQRDILPYWRKRTMRHYKNELWRENGLYFRPSAHPWELVKTLRALNPARWKSFLPKSGFGPLALRREIDEFLFTNIALLNNVFDTQGHLILGHVNVLNEGFGGIARRAEKRLVRARRQGDADGVAFLEAVGISCEAIGDLAGRFADHADRLAGATDDGVRRRELSEIAARCRRVPTDPPRDFKEALQALWLTQVGAILAYGMAGIFAVGRVDQYLYPYYAADLAAGRITPDEARAWLEELLVKLSSNLLLLPTLGKNTGNELGSDSCSPTIGGVTPDGRDAVNDLTYLWLDAYENVKSTGNSFMVRLAPQNPPAYWNRVMASFRRTSGAALFNDEVVVEALRTCGVDEARARDYGVIGCVEPTSEADTFGCTSGNDVSLVAALEMTFLDGALRVMGRRIGPATGDPRAFATFDEFFAAYERQLDFLIGLVAKAVNVKDRVYAERFPNPFVSSTLTGCVESARDMTAGGARTNFASIGARGFGTAVDSLAAVRDAVYERRWLTMDRLMTLLETDFRDAEVERMRLKMKSPVYGADDAGADDIAKALAESFAARVAACRSIRGGAFRAGFFSYGMHVYDGLLLRASPNGRHASEPVSNSFSPANGSERRGPIGVARSVAKIDGRRVTNGYALNIKFLPALFEGEERLAKMTAFVRGYFAEGGMEIQPNVVSNRVLREAQLRPDLYRDLVVRVSGYSAYFTDLGKPLQDEIISRTEFNNLAR